MSEGDAPLLEPAALADLTQDEDGRELLGRLTGIFTRDGRARVEAIRQALAEGDQAGARGAAHSLRGSAASLGAVRLARCCAEIEERARAGDLAGASVMFQPLDDLVERTIGALEGNLKGAG